LVVEDSPEDAEIISHLLREAGYQPLAERVQTAGQMAAALARQRWDLVIADHSMPRFDAPQALRLVQQSGEDLPFIIVSGEIDEELAVAAMRAGAHDFIMKDRLSRLAPAVARELREVAIRRERRRNERQVQEQAKRLQVLSRRLIEAQETERRAVARELHDEIGQVLTAVKINLQALAHPDLVDGAEPGLRDSIEILEQAIQRVRDCSMDLRPAVLDDFGLVAAVRWYLERHAARAGFALELRAEPGGRRYPPEIETACFRIIQEAVTNTMRHARATTLSIDVETLGSGLRCAIRDDGSGFDCEAARSRALAGGSIGLAGMQERVELLGGTIEIDSSPGRGTHIEVFLPFLPDEGSG